MRIHLAAAFVASLFCALLAASCVQSPTQMSEADGIATKDEPRLDDDPSSDIDIGSESLGSAPASIDALRVIRCSGDDIGAECMIRCATAGLVCPGGRHHPYKSSGGLGLLSLCSSGATGATCAYYYEESGDTCWFVPRVPVPLCSYSGGKP